MVANAPAPDGGNAQKFTAKEENAVFNSARDVDRMEFNLERQRTLQSMASEHDLGKGKAKKFRGDIEGPGRQAKNPNLNQGAKGSSTATPGPNPNRKYKMGDPELGLDVAKLNAYEAMQATMKEMGYDEGEEGEEGEEEAEHAHAPPQPPQKGVLPLNVDPNRKYKMGDPELCLDVVKLNAYDAMQATMKEMGYDEEEGEDGEDEDDPPPQQAAKSAGGSGGKRAQVQPTGEPQGNSSLGALALVAEAGKKFKPDPFRGEPPDFEPPPKHKCFEVDETGAGRKMQIAVIAGVVLLLVGCIVGAAVVLSR